MMQYKKLFQGLVALVLLLSVLGSLPHANAQGTTPVVVVRDLTYWDATYVGYVTDTRFEKWPLQFTATENFVVTAEADGQGFNTLVIILDTNGYELARGTNAVTASLGAGSYFIQVQPESGTGFYTLAIRRVDVEPPSDVSIFAEPSTIEKGGTAVISLNFGNIPAEGYTSAEVVCVSSDASKVVLENVVVLTTFGDDPAIAQKSEPENGKFTTGMAGSNGQRAYPPALGGEASGKQQSPGSKFFTIDARSPTTPPTGGDDELVDTAATEVEVTSTTVNDTVTITCKVRVSKGDGVLIDLAEVSTVITIEGTTIDPPKVGNITGKVVAGKAVTVNLKDANNNPVTSALAGEDGTFNFTAVPVGDYTITATAAGFLGAAGSATVVADETATKSDVTLKAGDIDGNNVIDQFDAMTIGMSYNTAEPAAADLNNDGVINVLDLEKLAANYRATGPIDWP